MFPLDDTIAAIASAPGGAARGIARLSGPNVLECLKAVFHSSDEREIFPPSHAQVISGLLHLLNIYPSHPSLPSHHSHPSIPCDLYLWPKGRSYTGQMVAEFHTLGSPPLLDALLNSLCTAGARMAQPGEFTLRAFLSGRIDLTQAEAVLGVIDAADPREFHVAVAQLAGGLATPLHHLRDMLLELLAHLEAGFDFADEDLPFITVEELQNRLDQAVESIERLAAQMESRASSQTAVRAVLYGQPNTGKSSLFNALTKKEHALVSDIPGTTRDYLVAELDFDGQKCQLIDTAGFHTISSQTAGVFSAPDQAAQAAAVEQIDRSHVRLLCLDATRPLDAWEQSQLARCDDSHRIIVWTKIDAIPPDSTILPSPFGRGAGGEGVNSICMPTSSVTGEGLDLLRAELRRMAHGVETAGSEVVASTAARCHESLHRAGVILQSTSEIVQAKAGEEFIAAEIRLALEELGKVVGAVYTDDVLDRIFSRFCVGK